MADEVTERESGEVVPWVGSEGGRVGVVGRWHAGALTELLSC